MIEKSQWVILPAADVAHLPGLRISPPGFIPQSNQRPRWVCDFTWSQVLPSATSTTRRSAS